MWLISNVSILSLKGLKLKGFFWHPFNDIHWHKERVRVEQGLKLNVDSSLFWCSVLYSCSSKQYVVCVYMFMCTLSEREMARQWHDPEDVDNTLLMSRQCKWNTRPIRMRRAQTGGVEEAKNRGQSDELRARQRWRSEIEWEWHHCGIMGESSELSRHLESYWGSGEEKLQKKTKNTWRQCRKANAQNHVLVSQSHNHCRDL